MEPDTEFETIEEARAALLIEEREYEDARAAYNEVLGQIANGMPDPTAFFQRFDDANRGHDDAATSSDVRTNHPRLAQAAQVLASEEGDFRAVDEAVANFAQGNCSIGRYTREKVYEYYASLEMVYKLATNAEFRRQVVGQLHAAYRNSALENQTAADMLRYWADNMEDNIQDVERRERGETTTMDGVASFFGYRDADDLARALMGYESEEEFWADQAKNGIVRDTRSAAQLRTAQEHMRSEAEFHQNAAIEQVMKFFQSLWDDIKKRYSECGLFYAVATVGVDGTLMIGEYLTGVALLRGLKLVRIALPNRRVRVEVTDVEGRRLGEATWSNEALEAKYGAPEENHVGGFEPDRNREIPDTPAEEIGSSRPPADKPDDPLPPVRAQRSRDELLNNGRIPGPDDFDDWWNDLSADELDDLWSDGALRRRMEDRLRGDGGLHEWLKVSQTPHLKRLGFSMDEIRSFTSSTRTLSGPDPTRPGERWRHNPEAGGKGSGPGSGTMHRSLDEILSSAQSRTEVLRRLGYWANSWLDEGIDSFPDALRDAILNAGGG